MIFIKDLSGIDYVDSNSDIFDELGMVGDDFHEMMEKYAMKYSVDMKDYLWYFHADEAGHSLGGLFFKPPYKLVKRIPVTPQLLCDFANKGKWNIKYPLHNIPDKRYDIFINKVIFIVFIVFVIFILLKDFISI